MTAVAVDEIGNDLAQLLDRVDAGDEIVIARGGQPIARLVRIAPQAGKREFGALRGILSVGPEFFEPVPEAEFQ
jgi:prevent-host-death family protein